MATKVSAKVAIRKEVTEKLKCMTPKVKQKQCEEIFQKLLNLESFKNCKRVSTYLSMNNEVNTKPIMEKIFETGKECFVPRYDKAGMEMVKLLSLNDWETLPTTKWGIKQPDLKEQRENALHTGGLDFIIVPGVAFTREGLRLGHGGGYYDRFLQSIKECQQCPPLTVGLAFKEQLLEDLPVTELDVQIDMVLYSE